MSERYRYTHRAAHRDDQCAYSRPRILREGDLDQWEFLLWNLGPSPGMSSLLLLLILLYPSASAIVDRRDFIETLTQDLASRASFVLYPVGCLHFPYSNAPDFVISLDVLRSGRLPCWVFTVICDCSSRSCQLWWHGYTT